MRSVLTMLLVAAPAVAAAESYVPDVIVGEVDVLVVLDSAPAAGGARAALAAEIGGFITELEDRFPNDYEEETALSLHLGFITGDLGAGELCGPGDEARLQIASADCFEPGSSWPWVIAEADEYGQSRRNFEGMTADAVRCAMPVAVDGCAFQQPLRAAVAALDGTANGNAGFLRPDAVLAILFVTTQDDCSARDPQFFAPDATGPATPRRCAEEGWTCTPAIDGTPQAHAGCVARDDSPWLDGVSETMGALAALKADPTNVVVGVIRGAAAPVEIVTGGALAPSCGAGTDRAATPGLRLDAVAAGFTGVTASVCDDVASPLASLAFAIGAAADLYGDYDPINCDGGVGDDDLGGAPPLTPTGSAGGCSTGGGDASLGALLLLALAAVDLRRSRRIARGPGDPKRDQSVGRS